MGLSLERPPQAGDPVQILLVGPNVRWLDGAGIRDENGAAEVLGIKGYPARKAMAASRRLGSARIARSIRLIGDADLDLRGRSAWSADLVAEVLVARLASLARR